MSTSQISTGAIQPPYGAVIWEVCKASTRARADKMPRFGLHVRVEESKALQSAIIAIPEILVSSSVFFRNEVFFSLSRGDLSAHDVSAPEASGLRRARRWHPLVNVLGSQRGAVAITRGFSYDGEREVVACYVIAEDPVGFIGLEERVVGDEVSFLVDAPFEVVLLVARGWVTAVG